MLNISNGFDMAHLLMHAAFEELGYAHKSIQALVVDPDTLDPNECFFVAGNIEVAREPIHRRLVASVLLFQAGMEGIYDWLRSKDSTLPEPNDFVKTWKKAFQEKDVDFDFFGYEDFYKNVRNSITHPNTPQRLQAVNNLEFTNIYLGLQFGWSAFDALSDVVGFHHDENSWVIMCNTRGVPPSINTATYPSLRKLSGQLYQKHLDFHNANR